MRKHGSVMSRLDKITISLPTAMVREIRAAVRAGEFANASEAVRDALRRWQSARTVIALADEDLRRLVAEGRRSGKPVDGETALRRLRAKYAATTVDKGRRAAR
jgi:antitoxin ParD1/3/4